MNAPMVDDAVPGRDRGARIGGLMRCCLATIAHHGELTSVGDTLGCLYADGDPLHRMVVAPDGVWEWDRSEVDP